MSDLAEPESDNGLHSSPLLHSLPSPALPIAFISRPVLPGDPDFDPWCLTDPGIVKQWKRDKQARRAIRDMWTYDPDPGRTLAIKSQIDKALTDGKIRRATDRYGQELGHFFRCPWSPVYEVVRPVTINGQRLRALEQFTLEVSAAGINQGEDFKRELVLGTFQPTTKVEYYNPHELPEEHEQH